MIQIILIRHGESLEDVNNNIYAEIADNDIPLTKNGISQVIKSGDKIRKMIKGQKVHIFYGTAKRLVQSAKLLAKSLEAYFQITLTQSALLKKQDWGSVTYLDRKNHEPERYKIGVLDYCYPNGESGRDVEIRTKHFLQEFVNRKDRSIEDTTLIIVTHGFNFRLFLKAILGLSDKVFAKLANPRQCYMSNIIHDGNTYVPQTELEYYDKSKNEKHIDQL